ncbi:unnamed protein product [Rhizoctonia solani]|uniref:Nephrocystin 3-like N-terminal domain-containing protein n=1 Tax=Rhizoctonia solani TaxID=456999 RepID=A0A8H3DX70_9AGAM|nr:unnamed protein product [Rhizoctonia solani]
MNSQYPPGRQEKPGIRQTMRHSAKWIKNAIKLPSSPLQPSRYQKPSTRLSTELPNLSAASRATNSLLDSTPPPAELQPVIPASGPSTQASAPDSGVDEGTKLKPEKVAWGRLRISLQSLETGVEVFPPLKSAVGAFIGCLDIIQGVAQNRIDYEQLAEELQSMTDMVKQYAGELELEPSNGSIANIAQQVPCSPSYPGTDLLCRSIQRQVADIERKQDPGAGRWLLGMARDNEDVIRCYRQVEKIFRQLQTDLSMRTKKDMKTILEGTLLQRIAPVNDARYNSSYSDTIRRRACTAQTREAIQEGLRNWTVNPDAEKIYWMNGMAGTGKTTIAYSYCQWLESTHRLGASFFCSRISSTCRSLSQIVPTVAYQLAHFSPAFRSRVCGVLNDDPAAGQLNVVQQFEKLVYKPIIHTKEAIPEDVVIVIDALDECDDNYSIRLLLDVLLRFAEQLPLKFFVASRPEPAIRDRMMSQRGSSRFIVYLHDIEQSIVEKDIKKYLTEALSPMESPPSLAQIELLARRSRNLFIYAATVVRYIYPDDVSVDSSIRLELMLDAIRTSKNTTDNKYEELDRLYTTVLSTVFKSRLGQDEKDHVRRVLWTVVCAREPMPITTIASLTTLTERQVMSALQSLRSVVHVPENSGLISTLHASFPEYMLAKSRSKKFHCNQSNWNETLAHRCFELMKWELRFNICSLENSYLTDDKVQGLESRVSQYISPTLSYACRHWSSHLQLAPTINHTSDMFIDFLSNRFLFWMEVLNLSHCIGIGAHMIQQAQTWLQQTGKKRDETQKQASDARNFITWFAANPCSQSTPHIYISALASCAKSSWVYQHYSQRTQGLASISVSGHDESVLAVWNVDYEVHSLAISPEGGHIATGSNNGGVRVYDIHTGTMVAGPFEGHTDSVNSVTFSPSEGHIATGSDDTTIIIWNALTGRIVAGPLRKHDGLVLSVVFSPDGKRVVSGSTDQTIIVWDSTTGTIVLGPLQGHTDFVWSVCFSPTGQSIASCSNDQSIRIWDSQTGAAVGEIRGHKYGMVNAVFSPDGRKLASCSYDKTIRIWDVKTRKVVGQPLAGHINGIRSMAFSSDNVHVVSGEETDGSIMVWNTLTCLPVLGPLLGHSGDVKSLAFDPDNGRIVSGSYDKTVRIWDMSKANVRDHCHQTAHEVSVGPVAFMPNHAQFISSSSCSILRLWDIHTGKAIPPDSKREINVGAIHSLTVSSRGTYAAGVDGGTIRVWNVRTGQVVFQPLVERQDSYQDLTFSPNETHLCSGSKDFALVVWDVVTGAIVGQPYRGHTGAVTSIKYSSDGTHIASGAADSTVRIWDSSTGKPIRTFKGHTFSVLSVAFSPDDSYLVSGSIDREIRRWEVKSGNCLGVLNEQQIGIGSCQCMVSFSPDGNQIIWGFNSSIHLLDTQSMQSISGIRLPLSEVIRWVGYSTDGNNVMSVSVAEEYSWGGLGEVNPQWPNIIRVWRGDASTNQAALSLSPRHWSYERDGRVLSPEGLVMWVPPDLVPRLKPQTEPGATPFYIQVILAPDCFINICYPGLCSGKQWTECYIEENQISRQSGNR